VVYWLHIWWVCIFKYICTNPYILIHIFLIKFLDQICIYQLLGTNRQKKQLFVLAVYTPSGRTLPGNLAIIPSEQSWVFYAIYQYAFPHLYSSEYCSRNCLVLTDKDEAEYRSFEALIKTTSDFEQSTVMLCTFHGVWMAFKKDLLTLLENCDCGNVYGTSVSHCINWYIQTRTSKFFVSFHIH
jgi:hypothetical protein